MNILIFIDHEIIFRNFIHPGVFDEICKVYNVKFIFPEKDNKRFADLDLKKFKLPAPISRLQVDERRYSLWNNRFFVSQMRFSNDLQKQAVRNLRLKTLGWKANLIFTILGLPLVYDLFNKFNLKSITKFENKKMKSILLDNDIDLVIHPTVLNGIYINDLIYYTKKYSIKSLFIMNSWDNPSTKRSIVGNPDWLFVWGDQTKNHSIKYMNISKDKVIKFGAPQFENYQYQKSLDEADFFRRNKVKKGYKIILYAGSSKMTKEIEHLNILDDTINKYNLKNIVILYRPHPWGLGGEGGEKIIKRKWKHVLIEESMINYLKRVSKGIKSKQLDNPFLMHNILTNIDGVISPLSTVLLEAAIHGKPSICLLPYEDKSNHFLHDVQLTHFQEIFRSELFIKTTIIDNLSKDLFQLIKLANNKSIEKKLKSFSKYFVTFFNDPYKYRILQFVKKLI